MSKYSKFVAVFVFIALVFLIVKLYQQNLHGVGQAGVELEKFAEIEAQMFKLQHQINLQEAELAMETQAHQQTTLQLNQLTSELFDLRKELLVYQSIMAPELVNDGLAVMDWQVSAVSENGYQFRFMLYQASSAKNINQGRFTLQIEGDLNGELKQFDLLELANLASPHNFKFRYFAAIKGSVTLPEGFKASQVSLDALKPTTQWQKFEQLKHTFTWDPHPL
ncbi:DUF6776 family protein [Pseudoalteromonas tunicata]|jgi:hypothetical protein|uniref:Uncharacterized conserved membrane or secreted protein n=1 Tax=Pseudoalteromonas tunicata D2 TaxID=87626 RepID=A4C6T8_9GAMM|nr:DUF6776 family protein [Pseudoalteromonas tunicata]ATC95662.1 hypothetical protein PTUN_a3310 [Pseudoalteromonas tunicata]AXT31226.1 hypothetical protein D1819_10675 [Pseudoalteromonas tunicata]EAR29692.1 Uncharacterized conserved membrane or secreted protein [Pseudoalteromonas tunicata D2]